MNTHVIYPTLLSLAHNVDYSRFVLFKGIGEKVDEAFALSYLIVGPNTLMVVDTGFRTEEYNNRWIDPTMIIEGNPEQAFRDKFAELNLKFDEVTHILHTHLHWDHVQLDHLFPNAKIYVQRREMEVAAAPVWPMFYNHEDIGRLLLEDGERLVFLDGDSEIVPGVKAVFAGGHTLGDQMIYVNTTEGNAVITGDILNIYANLERRSPKEVDVPAWVRAIQKIKRDADIILPGHDPQVLKKHPVVGHIALKE